MLNIVWLIGFFVWQGWCGRWRGCTTSWSLSAGFYLWHCRRRRSVEFQRAPGDCLILPSTEASCPVLAGSSTLCSSQWSPSSGVRGSEAASKSWVKNQERKGHHKKPDLFTFRHWFSALYNLFWHSTGNEKQNFSLKVKLRTLLIINEHIRKTSYVLLEKLEFFQIFLFL